MNVLVIGGGGREHALLWLFSKSPKCKGLWVSPGNGGTKDLATSVIIDYKETAVFKRFLISQAIDMVVVGPEQPLVDGIIDQIKSDSDLTHIRCVGPSAAAAQLEGSKAFAKKFMRTYGIPTAGYHVVQKTNLPEAIQLLETLKTPIVLKADGLAGGKGVLIVTDRNEAKQELRNMIDGKFGRASDTVVIEEFLDGIEFSVFVVTDGENYKLLPVAKDYKRIGEEDTGLNTGGMGSVSPVDFVDDELIQKVKQRIIRPTIRGLAEENLDYKGFIFFGLIKVGSEPYVIEYNCRMGDPESQSVFARLRTDIVDLCTAITDNQVGKLSVEVDDRYATTVMLVSGGYPEAYEKQKEIKLGNLADHDVMAFHSGTRLEKGRLYTNGGRVIAITALAATMEEALSKSYDAASEVVYEGKYVRRDIGFDL